LLEIRELQETNGRLYEDLESKDKQIEVITQQSQSVKDELAELTAIMHQMTQQTNEVFQMHQLLSIDTFSLF